MNPLTHWQMRNGRLIRIKDMSYGHLCATIALIERKVRKKGIDAIVSLDTRLIDSFIEKASMINESKFAMQRELMRRNKNMVLKI